MGNLIRKLSIAILAIVASACHDIEEYDNDPFGNFNALWTIIDEHYCFLDEKNIDWNEIGSRYRSKLKSNMSGSELFGVCSDMLDELRDGHTNLSTPFATSYYRKWWSDYPQNYNGRIIKENYFDFGYRSLGALTYGWLVENIGYIHYASFSSGLGEGNLDYILDYFSTANALILDLRDNGGGEMTNVEKLARRFIDKRICAGYISHKTGPGHNDFSKPYAYFYDPADNKHIRWGKPVVVITNRSTFSAANNFVSIMKCLPNVTIAGATTGGGSGMPFSSELPCGWGIRFSACSVLDPLGQSTEFGVEPTPGCAIDMDPEAEMNGRDTILDFAIDYITNTLCQ